MTLQIEISTLLSVGSLIGMMIGVLTYRAKLRKDFEVVIQEKTEMKLRLEQQGREISRLMEDHVSLGEKITSLREDHGNRLTEAEKNYALQAQKLDQIIAKLDQITELKACS